MGEKGENEFDGREESAPRTLHSSLAGNIALGVDLNFRTLPAAVEIALDGHIC